MPELAHPQAWPPVPSSSGTRRHPRRHRMRIADDSLLFAPEQDDPGGRRHPQDRAPWKVLLVDDEPDIHRVTRLALTNFEFDDRPLAFLHAYSAAEGERMLESNDDVAVALVDVVMESEHAGLDLVEHVRGRLNNQLVQIVLRTGQPGQAPERQVVRAYDINAYREKTELTTEKLHSTILTSLRSYRHLKSLHTQQAGLRKVVHATSEICRIRSLDRIVRAILERTVALLTLAEDALLVLRDSMAVELRGNDLIVVAGLGRFAALEGTDPRTTLAPEIVAVIDEALAARSAIARDGRFAGYFSPSPGREDIIYVAHAGPVDSDDAELCSLFLHHAAIAYENGLMRAEVFASRQALAFAAAQAIETRSGRDGQHGRRFTEYCVRIGQGIGLPDHEIAMLRVAAGLAGEHHGQWDGSGHAQGPRAEAISIYGRIGAVAEVIDALGRSRAGEEPATQADMVEHLIASRGTRFDPCIVDWVVENADSLFEIARAFPDS